MPSARGPFPGSARDCDLGVSVDLPESRLGNSAPRGTRKLKIQISRLWTHPSFNIGKFSTTWPRDVQNPKFTVVDSPRRMNSALGHSRMNPGFEGRVLTRVNPKEFSTMCSCHGRFGCGRNHVIDVILSSHEVGCLVQVI
ncbi:hypothetical protein CDL15_Pgr015954 [Punica granatum]|uniref:Uncharacterized protein n=1 Tax=Punica granatum TaxID=22663 RepID=A0A218XQ57_PUNGR|nr:hypothetical protein CDL15_Pgr015954 [Punica granatum]